MKKTLIAIACGLMLAFTAGQAQAVTIGDADYLGSVVPGTAGEGAGQDTEADFVNRLTDMALLSVDSTTFAGETLTRSNNPCSPNLGGCPDATTTSKTDPPGNVSNVDVSGWLWLYAKYGGDAHVWYIGDLSSTSIPTSNLSGQGLSHYTLMTPRTQVPDGGATLGLLGLGMLGLGYLRRRKQQ